MAKNKRKKYNLKSNNPGAKAITVLAFFLIIVLIGIFLYFNTDIFRNKRDAFTKYLKSTKDAFDVLDDKEYKNYEENKKNYSYIRKGNIKITSSSNIAESAIMDKLSASIEEKTCKSEEKSNLKINISYDGNSIDNLEFFKDEKLYGFYFPEVSDNYIVFRNENLSTVLKSLKAGNYGTFISSIFSNIGLNDTSIFSDKLYIYDIDTLAENTDAQNDKIEEYYKALKNDATNESFTKDSNEKIKIDGKEYKTTEYSMEVNGESSANLQISILNKLSHDSIMMDWLSSKLKLLNINSDLADINNLNENITKYVSNIQQDNSKVKSIKITVNSYKQKNIETKIVFGDTIIKINHLKDDDIGEISIFSINDSYIEFGKKDDNYIFKIGTIDSYGNKKLLDCTIRRSGSISDNNISNSANIKYINGIKSANIEYSDTVQFLDKNDLGTINDLNSRQMTIVNDYQDQEISNFIPSLINKINQVYVRKGSQIGINLDPIFE